MRKVFADTSYWIAVTRTGDGLHRKARVVTQRIGRVKIITSELVLVEYLNDMSKLGEYYRRLAVDTVRDLQSDDNVEIVPATSQQFGKPSNITILALTSGGAWLTAPAS